MVDGLGLVGPLKRWYTYTYEGVFTEGPGSWIAVWSEAVEARTTQ